jgi:hypothetical protein
LPSFPSFSDNLIFFKRSKLRVLGAVPKLARYVASPSAIRLGLALREEKVAGRLSLLQRNVGLTAMQTSERLGLRSTRFHLRDEFASRARPVKSRSKQ